MDYACPGCCLTLHYLSTMVDVDCLRATFAAARYSHDCDLILLMQGLARPNGDDVVNKGIAIIAIFWTTWCKTGKRHPILQNMFVTCSRKSRTVGL